MTSRILGVVREQVLASFFGAGDAMDAYNVAFRIPNLLRDLFAEGAMSAAFVPTFTTPADDARARRRPGGSAITSSTRCIVVTGVLVVLGIVFAEPLIRCFAAEKYTADPGKLELTVLLTRIMLPFLTLVALAAAFMGMLNSLHHFFIPALSPAMFNVATIICAFVLVPLMPAFGLPADRGHRDRHAARRRRAARAAVAALRREGFRYRPIIDWQRSRRCARMLLLMGPGTIGLAATQVNVFVNTLLATGAGTGAVSWLQLRVPVDVSADRAVRRVDCDGRRLPAVSRHAAERERRGGRKPRSPTALSLMLDAERAGDAWA